MAIKLFNIVSITSIIAVILLFTTLWNLQTRSEYFSNDEFNQLSQEANETNTTTEIALFPTPIIIEEPEPTETKPSWREIAVKYGTDKVTTHNYHYSKYRISSIDLSSDKLKVYEKHLQPMRERPLKMLEIGLGCNMDYGPGHSYKTWLEFFPHVDMVSYTLFCSSIN